MTTDKQAIDTEKAVAYVHAMLQPLIPRDPSGIFIRGDTKGGTPTLTIFSTSANMRYIIGRHGQTISAIRRLVAAFGWKVDVASIARDDIYMAPFEPTPDIRDLVEGWLEDRYNATGYQFADGHRRENVEWTVFVHPQHYNDDDHAALEAWAYSAARAQGQRLKVHLRRGGLVHA